MGGETSSAETMIISTEPFPRWVNSLKRETARALGSMPSLGCASPRDARTAPRPPTRPAHAHHARVAASLGVAGAHEGRGRAGRCLGRRTCTHAVAKPRAARRVHMRVLLSAMACGVVGRAARQVEASASTGARNQPQLPPQGAWPPPAHLQRPGGPWMGGHPNMGPHPNKPQGPMTPHETCAPRAAARTPRIRARTRHRRSTARS